MMQKMSGSWGSCLRPHLGGRGPPCRVAAKTARWLRVQAPERTALVPILETQLLEPVALVRLLSHKVSQFPHLSNGS